MGMSIGVSMDGVLETNGRKIPVKLSHIERCYGEATKITVVANLNHNVDFTITGKKPGVDIEKVIFNDPVTVVLWKDGTKTVVRCQPGDVYSKETGLALCIAKKYLGNKSNFNNVFKKFIVDET